MNINNYQQSQWMIGNRKPNLRFEVLNVYTAVRRQNKQTWILSEGKESKRANKMKHKFNMHIKFAHITLVSGERAYTHWPG